MTHVLLFHSVLGVRAGVTDTAERLRAAGHTVTVVDAYDGRTFDDYEPAMAHVQQLGMEALAALAVEASDAVDGEFVAVGFSNGAVMAQRAAAAQPERCRGVVALGGAIPMRFLEVAWPAGVPAQVHVCEQDPFSDGPEIAAEFRAEVEAAGGAVEEFVYPGTGHLFNDPGLPDEYSPESAEAFYGRLLAFVDAR